MKPDTQRLLELLNAVSDEPAPVSLDEAQYLAWKNGAETKIRFPVKIGPCGKHAFPSKKSTKKAIANRLSKGSNASRLRAYFCEQCKAWHMSSSFRPR